MEEKKLKNALKAEMFAAIFFQLCSLTFYKHECMAFLSHPRLVIEQIKLVQAYILLWNMASLN
jgi:hypothetical protein